MKKFFLLFTFFVLTIAGVKAQLPDGSIAPDWTLVDLDGNTHHLQDYLDQGKTVYIDMFATWCGPCWNYHQTHALENLYQQYGPGGTDQVMVFGIESDLTTPTNCIYNVNCPSSKGDWTDGVSYPIIDCTSTNGPDFPNLYALSYYPTIYGICPNGQIWEIGQRQLNGLVNFLNDCPQPPPLAVSYTTTDISCSLDPIGAIYLTVSGGKTPYTYSWSNGATSSNLTNIAAGTYSCTVTDNKGDQVFTGDIVVNGPSSLMSITSQSGQDATCEQPNGSASVEVTGGDPAYTYSWTNGATTSTITGLFEGSYGVNITDSKGCTISTSIQINNIPSPTVMVSSDGQQLSCTNSTVTINSDGSSTGPQYQYSWTTNNGNIVSDPLAQEITVNAPGLYVLTIFDTQLGCFNANFIQINGATGLPIANAGSDEVLPCSGGVITLNGGASSTGSNFTYLWTTSNGNIVSDPNQITIDIDAPGTYTLKVTNTTNGCEASDQTSVTVDNSVAYTSTLHEISCNGQADGAIEINQTNYTYNWSNGATTNSIHNLSPGVYQVTIVNSAGCTATASFTMTQPEILSATYTGTDAQDANSNDGTASATPTGGKAPYSYLWSNGGTTQTITNLVPGLYTVVVTDANGCTTSGSYAVNVQGCTLAATADVNDASCYGTTSGSITLSLSNVTGTPSILWNTGATTSSLENIAAGSYSATIKDDGGCLTVVNVVVDQPSEIILSSVDQTNPACPQETTGSITVNADGGSGNFNYVWNTGTTGNNITGLAAGNYTVTITDDSGCDVVKDIHLNSNDTEKPNLRRKTSEIPLNENGTVDVTFDLINDGSSDNCSNYTILMNPEQFSCDDLGVRTIEVTMTDAAGNKSVKTVDVTIVDKTAPQWNNCPAGEILANTCNGLVGLDPTYSDNCGQAQIQQIKGIDIKSEFPLGNTVQEYVVVDASGNSNTCSFIVHRDVELQLNSVYKDASCNQLGSIEVITEGGSAPMQYSWDNGMEGNKNNVQPGTYKIIVTDNSGCAKELNLTIEGPYVYDVESEEVTLPSGDNANGAIDITLNGDATGLTFEWSKDNEVFANTEDISGLTKGVYTLKIKDGNGCVFGPFVYDLTVSGYDNRLDAQISIFPNPTKDVLSIRYEGKENNMNIQIFDGLGRRVDMKRVTLTNGMVQISTQSLSNGTYRMIIDNGSKMTVKQFVVIK